MTDLEKIKRFVIGQEYGFRTHIIKGCFVVKKVKEKKLSRPIFTNVGLCNSSFILTIDLKRCDWFTKSGKWYTPKKGFRQNKIIVNRYLRTVVYTEINPMFSMMNINSQIEIPKINWLHED